MEQPTRRDMAVALFSALAASHLNPGAGTEYYCTDTLQAFMAAHPVGSGVPASSPDWQAIADDYEALCAWWDGVLTD